MTRPDDQPEDQTTRDETVQDPDPEQSGASDPVGATGTDPVDDDDLFAAVAAAISSPPRRDSASFGVTGPERAPEEAAGDVEEEQPAEAVVEPAEEIDLDEVSEDVDEDGDEESGSHDSGAQVAASDETGADEPEQAASTQTQVTQRPPVSAYDDLFAPVDDTRGHAAEDAGTSMLPAVPPGDGDVSTDDEGPRKRRWGRRIAVAVVLVAAALYGLGYLVTGLRMPANATIADVDVSGVSPQTARERVAEQLTPFTEQTLLLTHEDKQFAIDPTEAGLSLDVEASVAAVGGERSLDPRDMIALLFGQHDHGAVVDAEPDKLAAVLGTIGEAVDTPVVQPQITFPKGKPKARQPEAGRLVDKAATTEVMKRQFVSDVEVDDLPDRDDGAQRADVGTDVVMRDVEPDVDAEGLQAAMDGIAKTAVSGPVTIKVGDKRIELPVTAYAPALVIRVEDGEMKPYIDPKLLAGPLQDSTTGIGKKAVDATVVIENGRPKVVPGKEGVGLQPEEMAEKLLPAIAATGEDRSVSIEAKVVDPAFTTEDAEKLNIKEKVSSFQTQYPPATYRDINQGRAAELINGTIVKPGETFSFNDTVGERTQANGFVTGTVINGGVFREELGGGVSQVVTTLYNAAFFAGMDDVEHHPHAFYIDRYPVGREATVYWGSLDLRFRNSTPHGVLIRAWVDRSGPGRPGRMNVELWSTKVWDIKAGQSARRNFRSPNTQYDDSDRCVPQGPIQGFDIDIYRTFYKGGKKVKTETDTAVYQAADRVICGKKPKD